MPYYVLDSSALGKHYHPEIGTASVGSKRTFWSMFRIRVYVRNGINTYPEHTSTPGYVSRPIPTSHFLPFYHIATLLPLATSHRFAQNFETHPLWSGCLI